MKIKFNLGLKKAGAVMRKAVLPQVLEMKAAMLKEIHIRRKPKS
jgi:hypothetical protein